jgi:hypothetical protein
MPMNSRRFNWLTFLLRAIACLALTTGCASLTGQDFRTKIDERDSDRDGRPDKRLITMSRGKDLLLVRFETFDRKTGQANTWGEMVYFEGRKVLALIYTGHAIDRQFFPNTGAGIAEQDKDKDGKPDLVTIMNRAGDMHDAVQRNALGFLEPVSHETLKKARQGTAQFEQGMRELLKEEPSQLDDEKD